MDAREYEILYSVEDHHWWYRGLHRLLGNQWRRHMHLHAPAVLDVGCGTGGVLQQLHHAGFTVGLDIAQDALRYCQARSLTTLVQGSAVSLPLPDATFDATVMLDVLYHRQVPDKLASLHECHRVLRRGGVLFLNVPAYQWLYSSHDVGIHTDHRFTRREVSRLLQEASFEIQFLSYWNCLLLPGILPVRLVRKWSSHRGSDLRNTGDTPLNKALGAALRAERWWLRHARLPFGLSIFAVGKKR